MPTKIPLPDLLHYVTASLDGYVHFRMSGCKTEFIVPPCLSCSNQRMTTLQSVAVD